MNITLKTNGSAHKAVSEQTSTNSYSLDSLKRGTISGNIEYSLTDYYGKLHHFQLNGGSISSSIALTLKPNQKYELSLDSGSSVSTNGKLDFQQLYDKYQNRDLNLEDFKPKSSK
ncbi:hypothetical protein OVS_03455 [Mycoplasma ovis str. Michigan]|uniref:Uncharacterized protein n=1 Tax=Mycoplasma ovis str. Michigan TaxID=1415773 RepID=A0ABM5P1S2_9MOLU|nr:hypothetical protein [Mycoplasma ovis]AHC40440.1 hypothetical protein OVS_03455 [Mycoplasma ovis str. Michigan]